jgi:hypothetical protein
MRLPVPLAVLALAAPVPACGEEPPPARKEPVRLVLTAPADLGVVRESAVAVQGTVAPAGARVEVLGRDVSVRGGRFRAEVELEPGANLIDVAASADGRRPAFAGMRVVREERVPVPDVVGDGADSAREQLEGLGLKVSVEQGGGFFDPILPGDPEVCATEPEAGVQVLPGTEVVLIAARDC